MRTEHYYHIIIEWTGNTGTGTAGYNSYERNHIISANNKLPIAGSSDPAFRGDASRYNPEELFLASLSSCHMLWYLHLCASNGIIVTEYYDQPTGKMIEMANGSGHFTEIILKPMVTVADESMISQAEKLHDTAHQFCFIANSVNFSIMHEPLVRTS